MNLSKLLLIAIYILAGLNFLTAQSNLTNDYIVISDANVEAPETYFAALDAADWESFRLQNERLQLSFVNGFSIELKSAMEMLNLGYPLNVANYAITVPNGYVPPVLHLLPGNTVGVEVQLGIPNKHE